MIENQIRIQHKKSPSISIIRPQAFPKVVNQFESLSPLAEDMARAEQSFKELKSNEQFGEIQRHLENIMGTQLTPEEKRVITATAERLRSSREAREAVEMRKQLEYSADETVIRDQTDAFEHDLSFRTKEEDLQLTPVKKIGITEDLPISKSCCGIFSFQRNSRAEYVLRFIVRVFHFLYLIVAHPRTQAIFKQILKIGFDLVVALVLAGVSLIMVIISYGETYLKNRNRTRRQFVTQPSQELIQTFGPRPMRFDQ